jgi:lysophospholipase L1-like esterase
MRRRRATILLALVSALGTVLLVDVTFLVLRGPVRTLENFYEPAAGFGYRMRPNAEFVFASPYHGYSATVRTNARGLRDDEIHVPKPPGTFRVLLLGDSMTAGLEVSKDETFEAVCEERLRTFGEVEVVNAGVRGYNLDNILRFFESEGASYAPDLVAYLFVENDLKSASKPEPNMLDHSRGFTLRGAWGWLASYSHITFRPGPAYLNTAERIATLASLCHQAGADFLLAGAPHRLEIDPGTQAWWNRYLAGDRELDFDAVRAYLDWVAARHGLERFDPVPAYRRGWRDGQPYWFHKDDHMNPRGHRLLGQQLGERIQAMPRFQAWRRARARPSDPPES